MPAKRRTDFRRRKSGDGFVSCLMTTAKYLALAVVSFLLGVFVVARLFKLNPARLPEPVKDQLSKVAPAHAARPPEQAGAGDADTIVQPVSGDHSTPSGGDGESAIRFRSSAAPSSAGFAPSENRSRAPSAGSGDTRSGDTGHSSTHRRRSSDGSQDSTTRTDSSDRATTHAADADASSRRSTDERRSTTRRDDTERTTTHSDAADRTTRRRATSSTASKPRQRTDSTERRGGQDNTSGGVLQHGESIDN